jgi:tetratricopeptide (TPR) repeat protein
MIAPRRPFIFIVGVAALIAPHLARAQAIVLPGGTQVGLGTTDSDPQQDREQMKRRFGELIEQARALIAEQKWRQAREKLDSARNLVTDRQADGPKLRELYLKLENHGRAMLAQADAATRDGDYEQAMTIYEQIVHVLRTLPVADDARQALTALRADPEVRAYFAEQRAATLNRQIDLILASNDSAVQDDGDEAPSQTPEDEASPEAQSPGRVERIRYRSRGYNPRRRYLAPALPRRAPWSADQPLGWGGGRA